MFKNIQCLILQIMLQLVTLWLYHFIYMCVWIYMRGNFSEIQLMDQKVWIFLKFCLLLKPTLSILSIAALLLFFCLSEDDYRIVMQSNRMATSLFSTCVVVTRVFCGYCPGLQDLFLFLVIITWNYCNIFYRNQKWKNLKLTQPFRYVSLEKEEKENFIIENFEGKCKYLCQEIL